LNEGKKRAIGSEKKRETSSLRKTHPARTVGGKEKKKKENYRTGEIGWGEENTCPNTVIRSQKIGTQKNLVTKLKKTYLEHARREEEKWLFSRADV